MLREERVYHQSTFAPIITANNTSLLRQLIYL